MSSRADSGWMIVMRWPNSTDEPVSYVVGSCSNGHGWQRAAGIEPPTDEPALEPVWGSEFSDALIFPTQTAASSFAQEHGIRKVSIEAVIRPTGSDPAHI